MVIGGPEVTARLPRHAQRQLCRAVSAFMADLDAVGASERRLARCRALAARNLLLLRRDQSRAHAARVLRWIRRLDPVLCRELEESWPGPLPESPR